MTPISDSERLEVQLVLEAIHATYGYDFRQYAADSIGRRVRAAAAKVGARHLGELQHRLIREPEVFASMLDVLTVRVTEMFRDPSFYRAIRQVVLPILQTYPQIKIWHAGCSSGEEVYATAILLFEAGIYERSQVYATDMSSAALEQARAGVYPESSLPSFADKYIQSGGLDSFENYWSRAYGSVVVREDLRRNIYFFQHDLVSDYLFGEMQLIFCRNVLIYFGAGLRQRVLEMFSKGVCRGGFLCLGMSEALPMAEQALFEEVLSGQRIYRRRGES